MNINRGEIYYITRPGAGSEIRAQGRPAIVVSRQCFARTSPVQQVVFLTTRDKPNLETRVQIMSTGIPSTAICEQVNSVTVERFGARCGICTPKEMESIDAAIAWGLGLEPQPGADSIAAGDHDDAADGVTRELLIAETQRDAYREMYEHLLAQLTGGGSE